MTFGERVRQFRKSKKMSQNALAALAGVSARTIFGYEAGTTYPRTDKMLKRLADALGVTSEELVGGISASESFAIVHADLSGETQVEILTRQVVSFLQNADLDDTQKDTMVQAIMDAYWESRKKSREENDTTE